MVLKTLDLLGPFAPQGREQTAAMIERFFSVKAHDLK